MKNKLIGILYQIHRGINAYFDSSVCSDISLKQVGFASAYWHVGYIRKNV